MNTILISNREQAMKWWNNMTLEEKFYKVISWLKGKDVNVTQRHPDSLTGSEIEEIYRLNSK